MNEQDREFCKLCGVPLYGMPENIVAAEKICTNCVTDLKNANDFLNKIGVPKTIEEIVEGKFIPEDQPLGGEFEERWRNDEI